MRGYHEDCSVVLLFTHGKDCSTCSELLMSFAGRQGDYRQNDAAIIAVVPESIEELSENDLIRDLPFAVLSDESGNVRKAYSSLMDESLTKNEESLLFVLDSYTAPYAALIGPELVPEGIPPTGKESSSKREDELHYEAIKWLEFIGIQCPE